MLQSCVLNKSWLSCCTKAKPVYHLTFITDSVVVYISAGHTRNAAEAKSVVNAVITQNRKLLNRVIVMTYALVQGKWSSKRNKQFCMEQSILEVLGMLQVYGKMEEAINIVRCYLFGCRGDEWVVWPKSILLWCTPAKQGTSDILVSLKGVHFFKIKFILFLLLRYGHSCIRLKAVSLEVWFWEIGL